MKTRDLISMCRQNLLRRKGRTLLTVLGVVVGVCAITIMISIGIGMKESQEKMLAEMGDLNIITVNPAPRSAKGAAILDDKALGQMRRLPGVEAATPKVVPDTVSVRLVAGRDKRYINDNAMLVGLEGAAMDKLGYRLLSGDGLDARPGAALIGQTFAYGFQDTKRPEGRNMVDTSALWGDPGAAADLPAPYFDPLHTPLELVVQYNIGEKTHSKTYKLAITGVMRQDYNKGGETVDGLVMNEQELSRILSDVQLATTGKRPPASFAQVLVKTQNIGDVARVEEEIKGMGFVTSSMEQLRKPMEEEARQEQLMLGGLGAISLFVAALGITNTMIMSISERTREIGIMKALGCKIDDIRTLFLLEAGSIGLIGGFAAIATSLLISSILNVVQSKQTLESVEQLMQILTTPGSRMSVVPLWLIGFSLVFSVFIGLFSGFHPANKAVRIPALEAIKSE